MIFATGLILCALSVFIFKAFGSTSKNCTNLADYCSGAMAWLGLICLGVSSIMMIAKVLP